MTAILNKKVLLSIGAIVFVAAMALGTTYAVWSTSVSVDGNTVSAGVLSISLDEDSVVGFVQPFEVGGLMPGQSTSEEGMGVINDSTVPVEISMFVTLDNNESNVCSWLNFEGSRTFGWGGSNVSAPDLNGALTDFTGTSSAKTVIAELPAGEDIRLYQTVGLDIDTPNSKQGKNCGWTMHFLAETIAPTT